jgi:hypothetical protein
MVVFGPNQVWCRFKFCCEFKIQTGPLVSLLSSLFWRARPATSCDAARCLCFLPSGRLTTSPRACALKHLAQHQGRDRRTPPLLCFGLLRHRSLPQQLTCWPVPKHVCTLELKGSRQRRVTPLAFLQRAICVLSTSHRAHSKGFMTAIATELPSLVTAHYAAP